MVGNLEGAGSIRGRNGHLLLRVERSLEPIQTVHEGGKRKGRLGGLWQHPHIAENYASQHSIGPTNYGVRKLTAISDICTVPNVV